jgi:hypothetical protein
MFGRAKRGRVEMLKILILRPVKPKKVGYGGVVPRSAGHVPTPSHRICVSPPADGIGYRLPLGPMVLPYGEISAVVLARPSCFHGGKYSICFKI